MAGVWSHSVLGPRQGQLKCEKWKEQGLCISSNLKIKELGQ